MRTNRHIGLWVGVLVLLVLASTACGGQPKVNIPDQRGTDTATTCGPNDVMYKSIVAGPTHTCGLTPAGGVRCWGDNSSGQLGDDTTTNCSTPPTDDVLTDVTAIALGNGFTCALTTTGGVRCWGDNSSGQLGFTPGAYQISSPPLVDALDSVQAIAAGYHHVCALTTTGGMRCWGNNAQGQLGDGTTTSHSVPPESDLLTGVQAITTGSYGHTCALMTTGGVKCWGTVIDSVCSSSRCYPVYQITPPADDIVTGAAAFATLNGATDFCALMPNGDLQCQNSKGAGIALTDVLTIASGRDYYCALMSTGGVRCWGANKYGQLGDGTTIDSNVPPTSDTLTGAIAITAGSAHACALMAAGGIECWGNNELGQLGNGRGPDFAEPPPPSDVLTDANALAVGGNHTCALMSTGGVRCWGRNVEGQLGDGSLPYRDTPASSDVITDIQGIAAGASHTCALTTAGGVRCWGANNRGQLGDGSTVDKTSPPTSDVLTDVQAVAARQNRTCALLVNGGVRCWGDNTLVPPTEDSITGAKAIAVGGTHTCALLTTGGVRCWGSNSSGQLGNGTTTSTSTPTATDVLTDVQAIAAGDAYTCALMNSGSVQCWGANNLGQVASSSNAKLVPTSCDGITDVQAIAAGSMYTCVLMTSGAVRCWGDDNYGQLGDGSVQTYPLAITGDVLTGAQAIAAGTSHTCALMDNGGVRCWGNSFEGQLGDGRAGFRATPVWVAGTCY